MGDCSNLRSFSSRGAASIFPCRIFAIYSGLCVAEADVWHFVKLASVL